MVMEAKAKGRMAASEDGDDRDADRDGRPYGGSGAEGIGCEQRRFDV